ncbi:hypothetical protein Q3G72_017065 [Acer saccharum]|nr:hypothetical protein Q3G72_017065 [Acer saccharum]
MDCLAISAKFLGNQIEFGIVNPGMYTLATLCADVYMCNCSKLPDPTQTFKVEAKLPWNGECKLISDDRDLQQAFNMFREKNLETIRIDVELLPFATMPPIHQSSNDATTFAKDTQLVQLSSKPISSNSNNVTPPPMQSRTDIVDISSDFDDDEVDQPNLQDWSTDEDEEYVPPVDSPEADDDEFVGGFQPEAKSPTVSLSDNNSEDEQLSNAASYDYSRDFIVKDSSASEDEQGNNQPSRRQRRMPFKETEGANMQRQFKGQLSRLYLWNAANKSTKQGFMEEISKLKTVNEDAYNYIMKFRGLPALSMMEGIRRKMMKRMVKRLQDARSWSAVIPPLVQKKLSDRQDEARFVIVLCASDKEFEVKEDVKFYIVNLETQICDCGLCELSGLPCKHAMAVITTTRKNPSDFVHPYLTKDAYLRTYNHVIHLIPDQEQWPHIEHNTVLPLVKKRKPGRPKKNRKRAPEEPRKMKRSG